MQKRRPTQKDVAKRAGVSVTTVSQVINNRTGGNIRISQKTRNQVWQAVKELGYSVNISARSLRTQKTNLLAVMVPDITNPYYPELIRGVQGVTTKHSYDLLVYDADDCPKREKAFVDAMLRRQVDGVIMVPFFLHREDIERLHQANISVAVSAQVKDIDRLGIDILRCDDSKAISAMISHLVEKGHCHIAHLSGTIGTDAGNGRLDGYRRTLIKAGIPYDEKLVCYGNFRADCVPSMIDRLFAPGKIHPTAIFAANDVMAIAAIYELMRLGLRVPEDVAVCGYDNIPEASTMMPALTTIDQDARQMGKILAQLLFERLESDGELAGREVPFEFQLVIRNST